MDRNFHSGRAVQRVAVALRKESVDRNDERQLSHYGKKRSLSARRAWIEMSIRPATASL